MAQATPTLSTEGFFPKTSEDLGLYRLAFGVLLQALRDVAIPNRGEKEWLSWRDDAIEWFQEECPEPTSFLSVCSVLRINSQRIRSSIQLVVEEDLEEKSRLQKVLAQAKIRRKRAFAKPQTPLRGLIDSGTRAGQTGQRPLTNRDRKYQIERRKH